MAKVNKGKSKNGNRKHGRSKDKCQRYKAKGTREINKLKKAKRHLKQSI